MLGFDPLSERPLSEIPTRVVVEVPTGRLELGPKVASLPLLLNRVTEGYPPTVTITPVSGDTVISVPLGTLTLTGQAPTVVTNVGVAIPAGTLTLTGFAPTVTTNTVVAVPAGTLTLTGLAPTVVTNRTVAVPAGTLTLTGLAPTVVTNVAVSVPAGALTLTGYAPTVVADGSQVVQVPAGTLTLTGFAPDVIATANVVVSPDVAGLTLTGYAPTVIGESVATQPEQPSGGFGAENDFRAWRQRRKRKTPESKPPAVPPSGEAQAGPGSADATPPAPAADLELVRQLVAYWTGEADRELLNRRAQRALDYALRAQTVLAMQLFERELARQLEDDDMAAVLAILADD